MDSQQILDNCVKATNDTIAVGNTLSQAMQTVNANITTVNGVIKDGTDAKDATIAATNTCKTETTKCTTATANATATDDRMKAVLELLKGGISGGDAFGNNTPI